MIERLEAIKRKLETIRQLDTGHLRFAAGHHQYRLNSCLTEQQLQSFEMAQNVKLPAGYRAFLAKLGNGGAGPAYGLWSLQESIMDRQDCLASDVGFLARPFLPWRQIITRASGMRTLTEFWQKCAEDLQYREHVQEELGRLGRCDSIQGTLPICEYGSGIFLLLVVSGSSAGEIWSDNRAFGFGLLPAAEDFDKPAMDFLTWYETWLDRSIEEHQL